MPAAKAKRILEAWLLGQWRGHLRHGADEPRHPLQAFAMVVGDEHPLHPRDADVGEVLQRGAVAEVDHQGGVSVAKDVGVAGVGPDEQLGVDVGSRLAKLGRY